MWARNRAGAVGDGQRGGLRDVVGLAVHRDRGGLRAVGRVSSQDLGGVLDGLVILALLVVVVLLLANTELSRVLVVAALVLDQLETVVGIIDLKVITRSPQVVSLVGDVVGNRVQDMEVGRRSTEQQDRDGAVAGRVPGDVERLALVDLLNGKYTSLVKHSRDVRSGSGPECGWGCPEGYHGESGRHWSRWPGPQ